MKILAIDYGTKQIGIAVSNSAGTIAFPHSIIKNDRLLFTALRDIIHTENVEKIIVGKPEYNTQTEFYKSVEKFILDLEKTLPMPIETVDELLTSESAHKASLQKQAKAGRKKTSSTTTPQQKNRHDLAAVLILENYINAFHTPF